MADVFYTNEKLWAAVGILATGRGPIKDRLVDAFSHGMPGIGPESFPSELNPEFAKVWATVTRVRPGGDATGSLGPSIDSLTDQEAVDVARKILELAYRVDDLVEAEIRHRTSR